MMGAEGRDLRDEPFGRNLLEKLPSGARDSFSDEQLLALTVALGVRLRQACSVTPVLI